VPGPLLRQRLAPTGGLNIVEQAVGRGLLSARGVDKVLRLSWTVADLAGRGRPTADDVFVALGMRRGDETEVLNA
jgi:magnesium chelatase family protein